MVLFHILDAISQDWELGEETEKGQEIIPYSTGNLSDDEVIPIRRKKAAEERVADSALLRMVIYLFGKTEDGIPLRCSVEGFRPFFFVRLPNGSSKTKNDFEVCLRENITKSRKWLLTKNVLEIEFVERKVLFGYTANKNFPFAKLSVPSMKAFRDLRQIFLAYETNDPKFQLYAGEDPLEVCDANLDPMLRFFHLQKIKPCGWVETSADLEDGMIQTDWEDIHPATPPIAAAPFLNMFWDIECNSENGEFPLAKKGYDRLAKQLYETANSPEEAAELIVAAATNPENPPKNMDGLRHKDGKVKLDVLRDAVGLGKCSCTEKKTCRACSGRSFLTDIATLLTKKEGISISSREDRIHSLRRILGSHLKAILPIAGDPIIQIGLVLVRGAAVTEKHIFVFGTCDEVPGAIVHSYKTEKEMLLAWAAAVAKWNPDILTGYNVFGFDEKYVWNRAEELRITEDESIQALSRLVEFDKKLVLDEKFLSSSAMGDNTMYIWSAFGRLQVDLFHYIKRNFSLPAYKLDYVCQHFMSGKCMGVDTTKSEWQVKTKNTADVVVGRYVVLLDETGDSVVDKLKIVDVKSDALILEPPTEDLEDLVAATKDVVKWAIVKDDVSPQDIFRLHKEGGSAGRAKVAAYCIQDCDLTVELYKKLDVFNNAMAMANTCSVPVSYIFTRGQGIKIESLIFKECYERGQCVRVLHTQPRGEAATEQDSYEGAIVLTPEPGFYFKSPVGVADFASLYPSTIISENISYDSLVWVKNYDLQGRFLGFDYGSEEDEAVAPPGTPWTDIEFDVWGVKEGDLRKAPEKVKRGLRVCRYAQNMKGTLPDIVAGLLAARKAKRKEAEKETDAFKKALLDAEQLAYKLTANSLYGQLGSGTFKIRLQHLAASVTAYGRKQIMFAKDVIERFYGSTAGRPDCDARIVYGDTDSLFVDFQVKNPVTGHLLEGREAIVETMKLTTEAGQLVTTCLKPPHDFEYDKVFSPFIIFSKKRYVGNKFEDSPDDHYQNSMGIATKRRDYAGIVKIIYGGAIRILLNDKDPVAAATFVKEKLLDLAKGNVSMTQLTLTKSLRAEYKATTPPAHKMLAERIKERDPGNAPASGDRISFLYVLPSAGQLASKLQGDRIETPTWIREKRLGIDAKYYMEHQLMNPLAQLFALIVEELPGCVAPTGKAWSTATESDRETAAIDYLFRDALKICDKNSTKRSLQHMFGTVISVEKPIGVVTRSQTKPVISVKPKVQLTLFAQSQILKAMEPMKKARRKSGEESETKIIQV
jgi:DNA polymerase elongation subunit (family B)